MTRTVHAHADDPRRGGAAARRDALAIAVAVCGLAIAAVLVLAWHDHLRGGHRLRTSFEPLARHDRRAHLVHVAERLARFRVENTAVQEGSVLFLGSSTIERMPLEDLFPSSRCVNRGIANQSAADLSTCLDQVLPPATPAGIVLYTGAIDRHAGASTAELEARTGAILDQLRRAYPEVRVLFLGMLPHRGMSAEDVRVLRAANAKLGESTRARGADFLDVARAPIADATGALALESSVDALHLNEAGYRALARWIVDEGGAVGRELAP